VLAAAETGSGKTGAFALPVLQLCVEHIRDLGDAKKAASAKKAAAAAALAAASSSTPIIPNVLSMVDRDDSISIASGGLVCQSRSKNSWAGVRATTGITNGNYYFELTPNDDGIVRVGVSTASAKPELGKDAVGYGYGGTGVKVNSNSFIKYGGNVDGEGMTFTKNDVIGCFISITQSPTPKGEVSWSKNGKHLGFGFDIDLAKIEPAFTGLFPAVAMKNAECVLNFGGSDGSTLKHPPASLEGFEDYLPFSIAQKRGATISNPNLSSNSSSSISSAPDVALSGNGPLAIVLEPVRDLAEQTYDSFMSLSSSLVSPSIKSALLIGGGNPKPILQRLKNSDVDVLVGTPPIIAEMIRKGKINTSRVRFFVLDEADQLTTGEALDTVKAIYKSLPSRNAVGQDKLQVCFFSATLHSQSVKDLVAEICSKPTWVDLKGVESVPDTVHHCIVRVDPKIGAQTDILNIKGNRQHVITDSVHRGGKLNEKTDVEGLASAAEKESETLKELKPLVLLQLIEKFEMEQVLVFCR